MKFTKMQGAGNDFIVLDNRSGVIRENEYSALAVRLCRRRLSIGADGLMIVLPAQGIGDYAMRFYDHPLPQAIICYEREAFYAKDLPAFRITFDTNIRYRRETIDLTKPTSGKLILPKGKVIMEIKTDGAMPLWMSSILDSREIFPTSFSKYGTAYQMFSKENISYDSAAYYCPDSVSLAAAN